MSFDWLNFYYLAEELAGRKPSGPISNEARLRTAMNRAYYAAHWIARDYLKEKHGFTPRKGHEHGDVWGEYLKGPPEYPQAYIQIGEHLQSLYDYRAKADYKFKIIENFNSSIQLSLALSKKIIKAIEELKKQSGS